jgi:hypothetical protein
MKRIFIGADGHSGHFVGLTPPHWQYKETPGYDPTKRNKYRRIQAECWDFFKTKIYKVRKEHRIDVAIWNGDMVDGKQERVAGTEAIEASMERQAIMATNVIKYVNAKENVMTYGTHYHVSCCGEDWENHIAEKIGAKIGAHEWVRAKGTSTRFDVKHHVGSSVIPHGRHTAVAREGLWSRIWEQEKLTPRADVVIRSHAHYFSYNGNSSQLCIITPALQAMGTKYGARRCSGTVNFGFLIFDVYPNGKYTWEAHIANIKAQIAKETVL